ncbi:MAG: CBS domain-containing protein [Candidatus Omnitrophota bacterium]
MDLIVTHKNADFDALSSLVAASKLYPKARLLLPGSQEKAVRNFLALIKDKITIESEKTCRMDDVTRLIIVDNRHKSRIGDAAGILNKKNLKIHIYDHHPRTRFDIKADKDVFKKVGATVSIVLEILSKKRKLKLTPLEATLMLLGIYEETGFLSYSATTKLDVDMVGRLLEQKANLKVVSSYLNRELSHDELSALIGLLESIEAVNINGVDVAFAGVNALDFDGEMGTVVHKLQEVENYPVLFVMFAQGNKVKLLGRSRTEVVDVNKMFGCFGGGGHAGAASARIEGKTPKQIKDDIIAILERTVHPDVYAGDIMSSPVKTVSQEERVEDVLEKLKSFKCPGMPVFNDESQLVGIVVMENLKKAIKQGMGHSRIKGYMSTVINIVSPETPLYELQQLLNSKGSAAGLIAIVTKNKLVGVVSRTDVLKKVHSALFSVSSSNKCITRTNYLDEMKRFFPEKLMRLIKNIGAQADKLDVNIFLVGGLVRDLLLGEKNYDLDVVIEGDAIQFAKIFADKIKGRVVVHKKFGTATIVKDWPVWLGPALHADKKFKIDIASARKEKYEKPAALPTVEFSSLKDDLYRRDFTLNAMAININKKKFGVFIDFFNGLYDLKKGIIRVLHDKSFIDDPTRIFRAVRFEQRFKFSIEKHTEYLITHAVKQEMFWRTENQRIRDELILILKEEKPEKAVFRMRQLHELRFIHPRLELNNAKKKTFDNLRKHVKWYNALQPKKSLLSVWLMNFMIMLDNLDMKQTDEVLKKFVFTRNDSNKIRQYKSEAGKIKKEILSKRKMRPSAIYSLLETVSEEALLCLMAEIGGNSAVKRIKRYLTEYQNMRLKIKGHDIKQEGLVPGPRYKKILRQILFEKLDGRIVSKKDELNCLKEITRGGRK